MKTKIFSICFLLLTCAFCFGQGSGGVSSGPGGAALPPGSAGNVSTNGVVLQGTAAASGIWTNGQVVGGLIVGQGSVSNRQLTVSGNSAGNDGLFITNAGSGDVDVVLQGSGTANNPNFSMTATKGGSWLFYNHSVNVLAIIRGFGANQFGIAIGCGVQATSTGAGFLFANTSDSSHENVSTFQQNNALYFAANNFIGDDVHEHFATGWGNSQAVQPIFKNRAYTEISDIPPSGIPTNLPPLYIVAHSGAFPSVLSNSIHSVISFASSGLQQDFMFGGTNSIDNTNPPVTFYNDGNGHYVFSTNTQTVANGGYSMTNPPTVMSNAAVTALTIFAPTNLANVTINTNDLVPGAVNVAPNARFSVSVPVLGTATLSAGFYGALMYSNAADGKIYIADNFSITAGILAADTVTNVLKLDEGNPNSLFWITNTVGGTQNISVQKINSTRVTAK